jgi:peptidoglycan/xylan/chitin deacetylase (PgdA/CDA1 family)
VSTPWPNEHGFTLALSHDVDRVAKRWQFIYYALRALAKLDGSRLKRELQSLRARVRGDDPYWNFQRIMAVENDLGVRSTFFFMDERGRPRLTSLKSQILYRNRYTLDDSRIQKVIRDLDADGWEIGLHGSYESYLDAELLGKEKSKLESIVNHAVGGTRQHYLRLEIPKTWQIHAQLGFVYDSTLGYSTRVDFKSSTCFPFYPEEPSSGDLIPVLQIPLAIMDVPLMKCSDPWSEALRLIEHVQSAGGVLTLDWHQRTFNPWDMLHYQEMYIRIVRECQQRGAWVAPLGEIATWWQKTNRESSTC